MSTSDALRDALDAHGILRVGALDAPPRGSCFTVFAQRPDARVELSTWQTHATRFFDTRIGLTVDKAYDVTRGFPDVDAAVVVVAPPDAPGTTRLVFARPRDADDLDAAERAEALAGATGMALLARRCQTVWLVVAERTDDAVALRLSAILASVVLGPILSPDGASLFGVRTARTKLDAPSSPYR